VSTKPVRVLIDPGSHALLNLGDIAMLQVAVGRLRELWPGAAVAVLTTDPDALGRHCPGVRAVPAMGRYGWARGDARPRSAARALVRAARAARRRLPAAARAGVELERLVRGLDDDVRAYLRELAGTDLFLVSGRGGTCDAFADETAELLTELETAGELGVPRAMTSQGIGPLGDPGLARRAAQVMPRVGLIAVRERLLGPHLLEGLGVEPGRIVFTGDDAVEPALAARTAVSSPTAIGLGVRAAPYSEVEPEAIDAIGAAVRGGRERHGAEVVPIPISLYPGEADMETFVRLVGDRGGAAEQVDTVAHAIEAAGRCRVAVTGSYHAGVFAAAQGVPVVGLAGSAYYSAKLEGLRDAFGVGVEVVAIREPRLEERLAEAIDRAWATPAGDRAAMLAAAERQAAASRDAYGRLPALARHPGASLGPGPRAAEAVAATTEPVA
jgi:polysaccharide pyruvyl transferase WcaK-like protein